MLLWTTGWLPVETGQRGASSSCIARHTAQGRQPCLNNLTHDSLHRATSRTSINISRRARAAKTRAASVRTLLIDNYDSYTYNLYQLIAQVNGVAPTVIRNDELNWRQLRTWLPDVDNIVISPGPGSPCNPADIGVCLDVLRHASNTPLLGVCLGMQALALAHGGRVARAPEPIHGRLSAIEHSGHDPLFEGIDSGAMVVRYHSLAVDPALPAPLRATAWTVGAPVAPAADGAQPRATPHSNGASHRVVMAIQHQQRPHHGVQFHPESIGTACGERLLQNFRNLTLACVHTDRATRLAGHPRSVDTSPMANGKHPDVATVPPSRQQSGGAGADTPANGAPRLSLVWRAMELPAASLEQAFAALYGADDMHDTFWLDSADDSRGRFSFMGGPGGPLWQRWRYTLSPPVPGHSPRGTLEVTCGGVTTRTSACDLFVELDAALQRGSMPACDGLPFDFAGGFVGYLGYELKALCGAAQAHQSPHPDALLFLADRLVAYDHHTGTAYALALHQAGPPEHALAARAWVDETLRQLGALPRKGPVRPAAQRRVATVADGWRLREGQAHYLANVESCVEALRAGESYELCLTTSLHRRAPAPVDAWALYRTLRAINPAPYAAWLRGTLGDPTVACSSPERFLKADREGVLEAKPIKGTAARADDSREDAARAAALRASEKDRAENLMIVDLLRNDLGRVCVPGSVHVPSLMRVESFATVHQLVSTDVSLVDCIRAAFPGGSMTGAPKLRSMQLLDALETGPRGVYSGAIGAWDGCARVHLQHGWLAGFVALNGTMDLNVVIRSAVVHGDEVQVGAGGAVVVQSSAKLEFEEMLLKAAAVRAAVDTTACDDVAVEPAFSAENAR